jgi:hypothetical protein
MYYHLSARTAGRLDTCREREREDVASCPLAPDRESYSDLQAKMACVTTCPCEAAQSLSQQVDDQDDASVPMSD